MHKTNFLFSRIVLFLALSISTWGLLPAQWTPANADASFPRTLLKVQELPALRAHLETQPAHDLTTRLWNSVQAYNPGNGNFVVNGARRKAAFNAKNCAFFLLLDRKPVANGLDTLSASERDFLRDRAVFLLDHQNTDVESFPDIGNYLWRSNEIINNAIAYDLLKGAQVPDSLLASGRDLLQDMAGSLYGEVRLNFLNLGFFGLHVDNHSLRTAGALAMAGLVLSDHSGSGNENPEDWFKLGLYQIDNVFWRDGQRQSNTGEIAGYSEGPHYLRFGMKHVLPFFHSLHNFLPDTTLSGSFGGDTRQIRHPWYDPNYEYVFEWVARIKMPDGRSPALEDAFVATAYEELAIMERPEWCPKVDYGRWAQVQPGSLWDQLHHSSDDVTADYLASRTYDAPDTFPLLQTLPESGNLVFRSGWDSSATYMHFTAKNGLARTAAQGHNQGDASSFILFGNRELLALDPGYLKWDRRSEVGEPEHHNLILVDGNGPANGQIANPGGADAFIEQPIDLLSLDYSEVRTSYAGADITRKPLMVRRNYFLLGDEIAASSAHSYRWQLHGYGLENGDSLTGYFELDAIEDMGTWTRNDAHLSALVVAEGGLDQLQTATNGHEWAYDSLQEHTTLLADLSNRSNAHYLTALLPYASDTPEVASLGAGGALYVRQGGFTDFATVDGIASASQLGYPGDLLSSGKMAFISLDANDETASYFFQDGDSLHFGGNTVARSQMVQTLALERLDAKNYRGYLSEGGSVEFHDIGFVPQSVNGIPVQSFNYDANQDILTVQFGGGGYFFIHEDFIVGVNPSPSSKLYAYPNPTKDLIHIEVPESDGELFVHDVMGRMLFHEAMASHNFSLDFSAWEKGVYFLSWKKNGRALQERIVVQ